MIGNLIKAASCRVICGDESGTGWLIAPDRVLTARHCILPAIDANKPVELVFPHTNGIATPATILAHSEDFDTCLLSMPDMAALKPLPLASTPPREGERWETFGYPQGKTTIGHRLSGKIAQVLQTPKLKIDVDLSIAPEEALQLYGGMSGAAVVSGGTAIGMIRLKVDGTVAAISLQHLRQWLADQGVALPVKAPAPEEPSLADRGTFVGTFTTAVKDRAGNYLFLEGAHGYGKSTFCDRFRTNDKALVNLGAYCLLSPVSSLGADYRAQPSVLADWLATSVAGLFSKQPPRKEDKTYAELVRQAEEYLNAFSEYCTNSQRQGVLFIDGLNEISSAALLGELVGLLPLKLPPKVTVVLTSPNYAAVSAVLGTRVKSADVMALPPLSNAACHQHCVKVLKPDRRLPALIDRICEKAQGHPLYLRYLIEYANHQPTDDKLDEFPVLSGTIEDYYRGIWAKLLPDAAAINLLALMARLRIGIPLSDFAKALNASEQAQFVSVISRIRHLLSFNDSTVIYHSSFAAFILGQTKTIDAPSYRRLADFCEKEPKMRYCIFNRVYHLLRAEDDKAFEFCSQAWIDSAVLLGAEPDALLADVGDVLKRAISRGPATEVFRLMLLSQRITFRYDTLFTLSARSIAEAFISIGRPVEALQHVLRQNNLIVGPDDALQIGFLLHRYDCDREARALLYKVYDRLVENYHEPMKLDEFLQLCSWHIQTVFLIRLAGGPDGMKQVMQISQMARHACEEHIKEPDELDRFLRGVDSASMTYFLSFRDEYADLTRLKEYMAKQSEGVTAIPPRVFPVLCTGLLQFESSLEAYDLPKSRDSLGTVFADLAELAPTGTIEPLMAEGVADSLVRLGAPPSVVGLFATKAGPRTPPAIHLKAKNGVDVDFNGLETARNVWRVAAFLDLKFKCPDGGVFSWSGWVDALERVVGALYWCDGRGRRTAVDKDEVARVACRDLLKERVIGPLLFTLASRAQWKDAYAIPENLLPLVYRQLTELLVDCFPEELPEWLDNLATGVDGQWGLYTEGFRKCAYSAVHEILRNEPSADLTPQILKLLQGWRDHVLKGVENRHELVPEILHLMPFFSALGATEEAERLYERLLSVSMGPSWYKEDQLGLIVDALGALPVSTDGQSRLPQVAGYLERASGEMTFQRYVRAEKANLIGQIVRQGKYRAAVAYFRRQCCGSMAELWDDAQQGTIDRIGPLRGPRFPGGALEEQSSVLALVRNASIAPWQLRWSLLEIFFCGDERHFEDFVGEFAKIANEVGADPIIVRRTVFVADSETPVGDRVKFAEAFRKVLRADLHAAFALVLSGLPLLVPPNAKPEPEAANDEEQETPSGLLNTGVFGRRKDLIESEKIQLEARRQKSLGNLRAAKQKAVKMLQTAQTGGWSIWGNLSESAREAEALLTEGETSASDVIRYYVPLLEAEVHSPQWRLAQHMIGRVGKLLTADESRRTIDIVIEHVRLMVGDATAEIEKFRFLADGSPEESPAIELFRMVVWLCDHPEGLRRDRAAALLLWLLDRSPELLPVAIKSAFSMEEGYGPDVLCGMLDGASHRDPMPIWKEVASSMDVAATATKLIHLSRRVVLMRLATRAAASGSGSAEVVAKTIRESFTGKRRIGENPPLPPWATSLAHEWRLLESLVDKDGQLAWIKALTDLCAPVSIVDSRAIEESVSTCFRQHASRPLNRWESRLRFALNIGLGSKSSARDAEDVEVILRIYNPSHPERTVVPKANPVTAQLLAAIDTGDFSTVLTATESLLLNYHDNVVKKDENGAIHIQVLCVMVPSARKRGLFAPRLEQSFTSREIPRPTVVKNPLETCCHLEPNVVFFGTYTPAIPLPTFQAMTGAKDADFIRENWRTGRRHQFRAFGQPQQEGCSLSIPRQFVKTPAGFKFAWMIWVDGNLSAFVDEHNNSLI